MATTAPGTAATDWPSSAPISADKKAFLGKYFAFFDNNDPQAGDKIAELFTEDGCIVGPAGTLQGLGQIRKSRQRAWDVIQSRTHILTRVFVFDDAATDLMIIGTVEQGLANGKSVSAKWAARICLEEGLDGSLKLKSHEVYGDHGGTQKAIQEALS